MITEHQAPTDTGGNSTLRWIEGQDRYIKQYGVGNCMIPKEKNW